MPGGSGTGSEALRTAIRKVAAGLAERDDPYAGADRGNATRIVAAIAILSGVLMAVFTLFAAPTDAVGDAGWALAAVVIVAEITVGIALRRHGAVSFNVLLAVTYGGIAATGVVTWLAGGWESPYAQILLLWLGTGVGVHPPRRALTVLAVVAAVSFAPAIYVGWSGQGDVAAQLLMWSTLGLIILGLMSYIRAQRVAFQTAQHTQARLARRDPLTGLGNRRDFDETLEAEIARTRRAGMKLSVALLDVDGFKALNDELGHLEGDRCLRAVAAQLDARRRRDDPAFRWGGDEFALILTGADHAQARKAVERLSRFDPEIVAGDGRPIKLCTGIAEYEAGITPEDLLERADIDLFGAKDKVRRRARRAEEMTG